MTGRLGRIGSWAAAKLLPSALLVLVASTVTNLPAQPPEAMTAEPASIAQPVEGAAVVPASAQAGQDFVVRRVLDIEGPFKHGDYVWDDAGVPAGPLVITVDIEAQTLSVFRAGYEIGSAVILYGADDKPTPLGTFPITEKDADHVSNLYDAPMPYMLRLTNDGVAIHGSDVMWGAATRGCIGVPTEFAALLFRQAKIGDRVIITDGKMLHLGEPIIAT